MFGFDVSLRRPGGQCHGNRWARLAGCVVLALAPMIGTAACPTGDPTVVYCEDFSAANPLDAYTRVDQQGDSPFLVSIANQALVLTNAYPGLAFTHLISRYPLNYRNTLYEVDVRFNTANASLRSGMAISWSNPELMARIQVALQLDDKRFNFQTILWPQVADRGVSYPVEPNRTYRIGLRVNEVPGKPGGRPWILAFKGYVDGTELLSETEETLGVDLSAMPTLLGPGYFGGSYDWTPVDQVYDNGVVTKQLRLACTGFEPPLDRGPVTIAKSRALPFKMQLTDESGVPVTDLGAVAPAVQVMYTPLAGATTDVSDFAVPVGLASPGNKFVYGDGKWQFNLHTRSYTSAGTYTVRAVPGNGYTIEPTCTASFVVK